MAIDLASLDDRVLARVRELVMTFGLDEGEPDSLHDLAEEHPVGPLLAGGLFAALRRRV